jgi:hypothetical protein
MNEIPTAIQTHQNSEILNYLEPLSCHSDIISNLERALSEFSDIKTFCPDGKNFKYIIWYVDETVFACAHGMQNVWLRLPKPEKKTDKMRGAFEGLFSGESWWSFKYNYSNLQQWAEKAYYHAKNT